MLLNIFMETETFFSPQGSLMNIKLKKQHLFKTEIFCNIKNVFTVTFDQFNASLLNNSINFLYFF